MGRPFTPILLIKCNVITSGLYMQTYSILRIVLIKIDHYMHPNYQILDKALKRFFIFLLCWEEFLYSNVISF
jgi:hypothetical protein